MRTLLPLLKTKLFVLGFVSTCTIVLATTVPQIRNFIAPSQDAKEKITVVEKKIFPRIKELNKKINTSAVTSGITLEMNNAFDATLMSDAADYGPGSTATLTGAGFEAGETVTLQVLHADGTPDTGNDHDPWTVVADADGNFVTTWHVCEDDCVGALLKATADGGTSRLHAETTFTDAANITLSSSPASTPAAAPASLTICSGASVTFTAAFQCTPGAGNKTYEWRVNGSTQATHIVSATSDTWTTTSLANGDQVTCRITFTNLTSCNSSPVLTAAITMTVNTVPSITTPPADQTVCSGGSVSFSVAANGGGLSYQWKKGGGAGSNLVDGGNISGATTSTLTINPAGTGDAAGGGNGYFVVVSNNCGSGTSGKAALTVNTAPAITNPPTNQNGCLGGSASFSVTATGAGLTYQWRKGITNLANGGNISGATTSTLTINPIAAGDAANNYNVVITGTCTPPVTSGNVSLTIDVTPPVISAAGTSSTLGCNPASSDINNALGNATATDAVSPTTIAQTDGPVTSTGCNRSQTRTFTARDACGNTATTSRTATWKADLTAPVFTGSYTTVQLGCNPAASDITSALDGASASDLCGAPTLTHSDGSVQSDGCARSQTRTFTAIDGCDNTATISRTVTWTADAVPPVFTGNYSVVPLGCNPAASDIANGLGNATATDACGPVTLAATNGPVASNGCDRTQIRTFTARDGCGNTSSISRTVTWTFDQTPPAFTGSYTIVPLGCNPGANEIERGLGNATANDACSAPTITQSDGSVQSNGCNRSQTRIFTAEDACGNTATIARTVTWTSDQTPPVFIGTYTTVPLGCNPAASDITSALDGATASDACGAPTLSYSDGSVQSNGCTRSQTRTFTAIDDCDNTATISRTVTWTHDLTAPTAVVGGSTLTLGCNPSANDINDALGTATATDACGPTTIAQSDGSVTSTGCRRSQTRTFTARDGCGNIISASRTVIWTSDQTPPVFNGTYTTVQLGCNPAASDITSALDGASASDLCGAPTLTHSDGSVQSDGCTRSQTRTFTAIDGCDNTATISRTVTWTADLTPPTFTGSYSNVPITTCNPKATEIAAALDGATATDACGPVTITTSDGTVQSNGCARSQTRTFTARDGCNNISTISRTATWTSDETPPTFTGSYTSVDIGCNPAANDITNALDGATATDACGPTTVTAKDGTVINSGCGRSQTRTFTAKDGCGNSRTISRTVTWRVDTTPPTFTGSYTSVDLDCNPSGTQILNALDGATASDVCSPSSEITITQSDGPVQSNGCARSQTRTFTARDFCSNTSTVSRTVTWIVDLTPPTFTGSYARVDLDCNPSGAQIVNALDGATATDACGPTTIAQTDGSVQSNGCNRSQTRTFTARDHCGNTSSVSRTVTWIDDLTPPAFIDDYSTVDLDCNPSGAQISNALGSATATDGCVAPTLSQSDGNIQMNGCNRSQTRTWTARDHCGNTATVSRTVTWIVDLTPPGFTGIYTSVNLDCNPSGAQVLNELGNATATDACGPTTLSQSDGPVQSNGCNRSQTRTFTARDHCGNTASVSRTVTWIVDLTPPAFVGTYSNVNLGCNPKGNDVPNALDGATATDGCGPATISQSDGPVQSNGCNRTQTRTFTARDHCGNTATTSRTVTWVADETGPVFTGSYETVALGCNPSGTEIAGALDGATASDGCGVPTVYSFKDGDVSSDGCLRSQTRTFFARDACQNISSISRTVTWTQDLTPPTAVVGGTTLNLGCNPAASDINNALGTATATDACGPTTITQTDDAVISTGCGRSQKRTFTARDGCGNIISASRTVVWVHDLTPPTASNVSSNYKCITDVPAPNTSVIADEADNCGGTPTVTYLPNSTTDNDAAGCPGDPRIIKRYYLVTDACSNTSIATHTITVVDDVAPVVTCKNISVVLGTSGSVSITATDVTATSSDNCSSVSVSVDKTTFTDAEVGNTCSKNFTVTLTASDACGNTSTCSATVTVNKRSTKVVYSGDYSGQYSDVAHLKATLYDITNGFPGVPISDKTVTFTIGSQSVSDTYGGNGGGTSAQGEATASLTLTQSPVPSYNVVISFAGDGPYCPSSCSQAFDILPENACGAYNGTLFVNTVSTTNLSAAIRLQLVVTEEADGSLGDVRNASIVFTVTDGATTKTHTGILDNANSTSTQAVYYKDTTITLQSNTLCKTLDVSWAIGNYYTNASTCDNETEVTIAVPANDFSAGGGYIILTNSQGSNAGTPGTRNTYGYNVKWNNSMTNLQGNFNTVIRRNGRVYQVKSNKPTFLKVTLIAAATTTTPAKRKAEITYGNATLKDVTDIVNGVCVNPLGCWGDGNATVYLVVEDNGEPGSTGGTLDRIGFGVKDKNNNLWFSTNTWTNSTTSAAMQNLDGGNIQIRQASSTTTSVNNSITKTNVTVDKPAELVPFDVKAFPNPSGDEFNVYLEGANNESVSLIVYDALGREIGKLEKENGNVPIHIGRDLKGGMYMLEVRQGQNRKTIKLIKQN